MSDCSEILRLQGEKPYPRTCAICGLGPCQRQATPGIPLQDAQEAGDFATEDALDELRREIAGLKHLVQIREGERDRFRGFAAALTGDVRIVERRAERWKVGALCWRMCVPSHMRAVLFRRIRHALRSTEP